ncbi:MAG: extracellular solute-binding protein [Ruminococcaceae bacterium]|nr:extracellular solute-binding protein [Oscillospiraceae bacterium]
MKKIISFVLAVLMVACVFAGCASKESKEIVIYSCANDKRIAEMTEILQAEFPEYTFVVEYQSTSKLGSKLLAEGENTDCDIIHDLSYLTLDALDAEGLLADLSEFDASKYDESLISTSTYLPECRTGGGIIVNTKVLAAKNLEKPTSYEDLLKPEYKGLISMPNPKASGTGYMFYKSLCNAWGEEKAVEYFKQLAPNVLQFTESGNGPVNALVQEEVAIGLGMIANAATQITENGAPLEVLFFEEGAPFSTYGQAIVKGKEEKAHVKEVFEFLIGQFNIDACEKWAPEKIFKDLDLEAPNFPKEIKYSDMSNDTTAEKERLLELWPID